MESHIPISQVTLVIKLVVQQVLVARSFWCPEHE